MASLNRVLLIGNLTRNPEIRYTPSGSAVCEFGIAVNRRFVQANGAEKDEACFIDIVVWGKQAESTSRYLQKGSSVFIEGRLVYDQWEEKETQKKRSRLRVNAERVQFLDRRDDGRGGMPGEFPDAPPQQGGYNQGNNYQQNRGMRQDYAPRQQQYRPAPNGGNHNGQVSYDEPPSMPSDDAQYVPVDGVEDDIPF
jgi:single-strand DNA-binding protein